MLVTVNRVVIPDYEIDEESARVEERGVDERRHAAARNLVIRELLRQRAGAAGFDTESDLDGALDELLEHEVHIPDMDEDMCRRYYESNAERFRTPERMEVRHILLAAAPDDIEARARAEDRAKELVRTLGEDAGAFATLAAQHSACPSSEDGGHLGIIERGQTVPEFEDVVLRLEPGVAERPVETRYGFHVVEVLSREGGEPLAYEQVRHLVVDYVRERAWRRAVSQYIGRLAADAEIRGIDLGVDDSPLVQ
ncbi:MAG: peptidylprolyl isomerase [Halofilum sp. (in: g-proteobacteria)]|nr:peptidylprolyl isomerase [Halofilum sp. (in: g-proteobacteria)]